VPKKKGKGNVKPNPETSEKKSKFYVSQDGQAKETPKVVDNKKDCVDEPKKLERSNSFLGRKLSKIYTKISGSKESLDKGNATQTPEVKTSPFRFQRSLTLNSIQLKKSYRNPFVENRLEKLSEEKISENEKLKSPPMSPPTFRSRSPTSFRQSMPPGSFDTVDNVFLKPPPKLERSDSFISLIRRKISFNDAKPSAMNNSNWATSLQNLQQIDNMVSYENLSFVDYDKFNQYEREIDKMLNRLKAKPTPEANETFNPVVRRRKKSSKRMMGDFNSNLDREKNLYRQSIDSNKLRFLSSINSDSHRWSQVYSNPIDWLSLENAPQDFTTNLYDISHMKYSERFFNQNLIIHSVTTQFEPRAQQVSLLHRRMSAGIPIRLEARHNSRGVSHAETY
jgi:hypothetical protein